MRLDIGIKHLAYLTINLKQQYRILWLGALIFWFIVCTNEKNAAYKKNIYCFLAFSNFWIVWIFFLDFFGFKKQFTCDGLWWQWTAIWRRVILIFRIDSDGYRDRDFHLWLRWSNSGSSKGRLDALCLLRWNILKPDALKSTSHKISFFFFLTLTLFAKHRKKGWFSSKFTRFQKHQ